MGIFGERCDNCGSYNMVRISKDDPEFDETFWWLCREMGYRGTMKKLYKCRRCDDRYVWYDCEGKRWSVIDKH